MQNLPRLLYVGDVPVESTVAGAALMYRLLQKYPSDLRIVEGNTTISKPESRLANVVYETLYVGSKRLLHSRFVSGYRSFLYLTTKLRSSKLARIVNNFHPEAILTVAYGFSWLAASALAEHFKLPLHLIVHDDWPSQTKLLPWLKDAANKQFGNIYRQAKSRLCVSPYMVECYEKRYGVKGSVLYPSRAADVPEFEQPSAKYKLSSAPLVFAYAGSINSQGQANNLISLASVLEPLSGKLIVYCSLTKESINRIGLNKDNVIIRPIIPYKKLIYTLQNEADVLFVPMNFDTEYQSNMQLCFPSKLTDYTATALPLLIWGPFYCSAVRWAKENPGVAEVVEQEDIEELARAVNKLAKAPEYRLRLATNALTKGHEYFSHATVTQNFYQLLAKA